ncbi:fatty acyl-CoA hydrolase precursor, medium chain [Dermatophagoides farinae]|uniref:fatty acyl-CoA hydrolase precursor, medium chain n=1 Tax=Dermatophagoides farinae TaxID=6954 RepID=UPI003F63800D
MIFYLLLLSLLMVLLSTTVNSSITWEQWSKNQNIKSGNNWNNNNNNWKIIDNNKHSNNRSIYSWTSLPDRIVSLKNGARVRGKIDTSASNKGMYFFKSIRFGEVPVRFGLPKMARPWSGIYDATFSRGGCAQGLPFISRIEECLFINIWQPFDRNNLNFELKPVIVYFYGSGFNFGNINILSTQLFDGGRIADLGDCVFVTVQYRLGSFGFLYAGTDRAPGNQGVHDMILSLRWIQENIDRFGGDPRNVTVFGQSAGSMSISTMIISPLARGLFHRAIMRSGSINEYLAYSPENSLKNSKKFAKRMKCPIHNMDMMVDCLQNKSVEELTFKTLSFNLPAIFEGKQMFLMYGDKGGIMPERPSKMLAKGIYNPVDLISGFTYGELGTITTYILPELINGIRKFTYDDMKRLFRKSLMALQGPPDYIRHIFNFYTKNLREYPANTELRRTLVDTLSDGIMICPTYLFTLKYAQMLSRNSSNTNRVYSYRFDHFSPYMMLVLCFRWMGPCHGADVPIMFGMAASPNLLPIIFTSTDTKISKQIIRTWVNFARHGKPGAHLDGLEWPEFRSTNQRFGDNKTQIAWKQMIIDQPYRITINSNFYRCKFWEPVLFPDNPDDYDV